MIAQTLLEELSDLNRNEVVPPLMKEKVEGRGCKKCSLLLPKLPSVALQQGFNQEGSLLLWRVTWRRKKESASILLSHISAVCSIDFSSKKSSECVQRSQSWRSHIPYLVELSSLVMATDVKKDYFWYNVPMLLRKAVSTGVEQRQVHWWWGWQSSVKDE